MLCGSAAAAGPPLTGGLTEDESYSPTNVVSKSNDFLLNNIVFSVLERVLGPYPIIRGVKLTSVRNLKMLVRQIRVVRVGGCTLGSYVEGLVYAAAGSQG